MNSVAMNPIARKAVLIVEGEDGNALVTTVYDPRFEHKEFPMGGVHNAITFTSALAFSTSRTEAARKKAVSTYDEGARVFSGTETIPVMASEDEIKRWMKERHEDALQAVYLAGILAGAEQVKFHDANIEKQLSEAPIYALNRLETTLLARLRTERDKASAKVKGLKTAIRSLRDLRTTYIEKVPE